MIVSLRRSVETDLGLLEEIEQSCFSDFQRSSKRTLQLSLTSSFQEVWLAELKKGNQKIVVGNVILHVHSRTLRLFSLAVLPEYQGKGIGLRLINHTCSLAIVKGCEKVSLEARRNDETLIQWYKKLGFQTNELLVDYYTKGEDAWRMVFTISRPKSRIAITNLIIVDHPKSWKLNVDNVQIISAKNYISKTQYQSNRNFRVFNLSNSYRYQSLGYYVSLLASAREHRAIPSVTTIRDFKNITVIRSIASDVEDLIQVLLAKKEGLNFTLNVYFGNTFENSLKTLAKKLYQLFESPLIQVVFVKNEKWMIQRVIPLSLNKIIDVEQENLQVFAHNYFSKKRFQKPRLKHYKYDLAILVNPNEANPPSCPQALKKFKEVANKNGFYVDFITKDDFDDICEYDALFIRETTNVNDYTYEFSRMAYAEGLVVIDDPWSILRCANKIFLNERMRQNKIPTPKTAMLSKGVYKACDASKFTFPLVLKQPDSAFSIGVIKVNTAKEMNNSLNELFQKSDMVIVQEFLFSEYDWRIGVLDNLPLFACKYYMAKNHWQIYNWQASKEDGEGDSETVSIDEVPDLVLKVALKAASLMGDGLYGVDLKMVGDKVYVIEVNDNPNIDAGIEDAVLQEELYDRVVKSIFNRIELSRNMTRLVAIAPD